MTVDTGDVSSGLPTSVTPRTTRLLRIFAGTMCALIGANLCLLSTRFYLRWRQRLPFKLEDWLLNISFLLAVVWFSLQFSTLIMFQHEHYGDLTPGETRDMFRGGLIAYPFWSVAMCCVKASVLVTLIRIKDNRWWRGALYTFVAVQVVFTVGDLVAEGYYFRVLTTIHCAETPDDPCGPIYTVLNYLEAAFPLATDVIISLLPITFLVQLRRPKWEKVLIGGLMSLGLIASTFSILKMVVNTHWVDGSTSIPDLTTAFYTYAGAELLIGIVAAVLFSLKAAFYKLLKEVGIEVRTRIERTFKNADDLPDFSNIQASVDSAATETSKESAKSCGVMA